MERNRDNCEFVFLKNDFFFNFYILGWRETEMTGTLRWQKPLVEWSLFENTPVLENTFVKYIFWLKIRCYFCFVSNIQGDFFNWPSLISVPKRKSPITAAVPVNLDNKKGCDCLIGGFLFCNEIGEGQLKNHPVF